MTDGAEGGVTAGQVYVRRSGPPLRLTVKRPSQAHPGWWDCAMRLGQRSFGTRPVPGELLLGDGFELADERAIASESPEHPA